MNYYWNILLSSEVLYCCEVSETLFQPHLASSSSPSRLPAADSTSSPSRGAVTFLLSGTLPPEYQPTGLTLDPNQRDPHQKSVFIPPQDCLFKRSSLLEERENTLEQGGREVNVRVGWLTERELCFVDFAFRVGRMEMHRDADLHGGLFRGMKHSQ